MRPQGSTTNMLRHAKAHDNKTLSRRDSSGHSLARSRMEQAADDRSHRTHRSHRTDSSPLMRKNSSKGSTSGSASGPGYNFLPFATFPVNTTFLKAYPPNSAKKRNLDRALVKFIAQDMRPSNVIEGAGFRNLVSKLDHRYNLPTRRTIRQKLVPELAEEEKKKLLDLIQDASSVALTTDLWTSRNCDAYIAVTSHFLRPDSKTGIEARLLACPKFDGRHTAENIKMVSIKGNIYYLYIISLVFTIIYSTCT